MDLRKRGMISVWWWGRDIVRCADGFWTSEIGERSEDVVKIQGAGFRVQGSGFRVEG
jgi:hypothetical protein